MLRETQLLTIALATVPTLLVVAIGILLNNHRLTDVKESLHAEIKAGDSAILSQMLNTKWTSFLKSRNWATASSS